MALSPAYHPPVLAGLTLDKNDPFHLGFIVDPGQERLEGRAASAASERLIRYFMASMAIAPQDTWVNLSPYEGARVVPKALGQTDMGRDLLAQDYLLKQLSASLMDPDQALGRAFWSGVYAQSQSALGTTRVAVNTFNKVWITVDRAEVAEQGHAVFIVSCHLKVMLEEDYLAASRHAKQPAPNTASTLIRRLILPALEQEVNEGAHFARLRQICHSIILASWYKRHIRHALLNELYTNQGNVRGIDLADQSFKEFIYRRYVEAYKKGVLNFIREEREVNGDHVPHKYFVGGFEMGPVLADPAVVSRGRVPDRAGLLADTRFIPSAASSPKDLPSSGVDRAAVADEEYDILEEAPGEGAVQEDTMLKPSRGIRAAMDREAYLPFIQLLDNTLRDKFMGWQGEKIRKIARWVGRLSLTEEDTVASKSVFPRAFRNLRIALLREGIITPQQEEQLMNSFFQYMFGNRLGEFNAMVKAASGQHAVELSLLLEIITKLAFWRIEHGLRQPRMADKIGLASGASIGELEAGKPSEEFLRNHQIIIDRMEQEGDVRPGYFEAGTGRTIASMRSEREWEEIAVQTRETEVSQQFSARGHMRDAVYAPFWTACIDMLRRKGITNEGEFMEKAFTVSLRPGGEEAAFQDRVNQMFAYLQGRRKMPTDGWNIVREVLVETGMVTTEDAEELIQVYFSCFVASERKQHDLDMKKLWPSRRSKRAEDLGILWKLKFVGLVNNLTERDLVLALGFPAYGTASNLAHVVFSREFHQEQELHLDTFLSVLGINSGYFRSDVPMTLVTARAAVNLKHWPAVRGELLKTGQVWIKEKERIAVSGLIPGDGLAGAASVMWNGVLQTLPYTRIVAILTDFQLSEEVEAPVMAHAPLPLAVTSSVPATPAAKEAEEPSISPPVNTVAVPSLPPNSMGGKHDEQQPFRDLLTGILIRRMPAGGSHFSSVQKNAALMAARSLAANPAYISKGAALYMLDVLMRQKLISFDQKQRLLSLLPGSTPKASALRPGRPSPPLEQALVRERYAAFLQMLKAYFQNIGVETPEALLRQMGARLRPEDEHVFSNILLSEYWNGKTRMEAFAFKRIREVMVRENLMTEQEEERLVQAYFSYAVAGERERLEEELLVLPPEEQPQRERELEALWKIKFAEIVNGFTHDQIVGWLGLGSLAHYRRGFFPLSFRLGLDEHVRIFTAMAGLANPEYFTSGTAMTVANARAARSPEIPEAVHGVALREGQVWRWRPQAGISRRSDFTILHLPRGAGLRPEALVTIKTPMSEERSIPYLHFLHTLVEFSPDNAQTSSGDPVGGIDLDTTRTVWSGLGTEGAERPAADRAFIARLRQQGIQSLTPRILKITPVESLVSLAGAVPPAASPAARNPSGRGL